MNEALLAARSADPDPVMRSRGPGVRTSFGADGLFANVLECIPSFVLLVDASGGVRYANQAARAFAVRVGENLLASDLIHEEDRAAARATFDRLLEMPGQAVSSEVRLQKNGAWPRVIVTCENLLADRRVGFLLVTATDAARRHELASRVQQAERIEAIGRLAGGVAHDFNNFLTTIQGLTRIVIEDPALPAESRADLAEVVRAAERASSVTRRLLAFSRRQLLRPQVIDVNAWLGEARRTLATVLGDGIALGVEAAAQDGCALVDPAQLEQILLNLALNARDALPDGGVVTLRTEDCTIGPETPNPRPYEVRTGDYLCVQVCDNGPGIPQHLREQVFEPFFTTKPSQHASGLGLSTVYGIVKQSGGYVWIGEGPAGGACISILLPRAGMHEVVSPPAAAAQAERRDATVLVAEDDSTVRFLARRVLVREGYTVLEADDGDRAAEICATYDGDIDLLLSDVVMPGLNGRELVERCRRTRPQMAVIFMSGYQDDVVFRQGVGTGEHELIEKPFQPDTLARRVRERLDAQPAG